jgi:hypothetical protein
MRYLPVKHLNMVLNKDEDSQPKTTEVIKDLIALDEDMHCSDPEIDQRADVLIKILVDQGYWPARNKTGQYTAKQMWRGYGHLWNEYAAPLSCPHCNADLRDKEYGPPFKREIAIVENDRLKNLRCPDCNKDF